jgi:hypothetical protein
VLAAVVEAAPARLVRKLDKDPERAEGWTWSEADGVWTVDAGKATVTLSPEDGVVSRAEQIACDCLLAPRCLHVLGTLYRLQIAEDAGEETVAAAEPEDAVVVTLDARAQRAAAGAARTLSQLVVRGAERSGVIVQGQLLRDAHGCRVAQLPRLAAALLRVRRQLQALREAAPHFELPALVADLAEAVEVAGRLQGEVAHPDDVGQARRGYDTVGTLRLHGLFTEPVRTGTGYAGVVTWLTDAGGTLYAVRDVRPGDDDRVGTAYRGGVDVGDVRASHAELGRAGLYLSDATASASGRLGRGAQVQAVLAPASPWADQERFARGAAAQVAGCLVAAERPLDARREGWDLVFLHGHARGGRLDVGGRPFWLAPASDREALRFRDNHRLLEQLDAEVRIVARVDPARAHVLAPLAVQPIDDGLVLPDRLEARCNLGLDRLDGVAIRRKAPVVPRPVVPDPTWPLRRLLERVAIGGRLALPPSSLGQLARDAAQLRAQQVHGGASALLALHGADDAALARTFAMAHAYERTWRLRFQRQTH